MPDNVVIMVTIPGKFLKNSSGPHGDCRFEGSEIYVVENSQKP